MKQKQPIVRRLLRSKIVIMAEVVLLVVLSSALAKEVVRKYQVESEIRQLEDKKAELNQQNLELTELVKYFNEDSYKEEQARLKLGLQKSGESVVAVLGAETAAVESEDDTTQSLSYVEDANQTNPQRWWKYFFKTERES